MTYIGMQRYEIIQQERNSADTTYNSFSTADKCTGLEQQPVHGRIDCIISSGLSGVNLPLLYSSRADDTCVAIS